MNYEFVLLVNLFQVTSVIVYVVVVENVTNVTVI